MPLAPSSVRCVIVDESVHAAAGLQAALREFGRADVLAITSDVGAIADLTGQLRPDVVLLGCDPAVKAAGLGRDASVPVVVISGQWGPTEMVTLLRAGVTGLLARASTTDEILAAMASAAKGVLSYPAGWELVLVGWLQSSVPPVERFGPEVLTDREQEIVRLVVAGCSTKRLAGELGIAQQTAKNHLGHIMRKVGVRSRVQLCSWGIEQGISVATARAS